MNPELFQKICEALGFAITELVSFEGKLTPEQIKELDLASNALLDSIPNT